MSDFEDDDSGVYMSMNFDVRVIRMMEMTLVPSRLKLRFDISPVVMEDSNALGLTALHIRAWFRAVVESIVIVSTTNLHALTMLFGADGALRVSNALMLVHGEPTDDLLAAVFLAKLNAMADLDADEDAFLSCDVLSDNMLGIQAAFVGDPRSCLPTIDEWIGERRYFDEPWWNRNDISTYDVQPALDADLGKKPVFPTPAELLFGSPAPKDDEPEAEKKPTVLRPQFKPTIIDGGKKPDA